MKRFLRAERGSSRFLAAAPNTRLAAPIIIATGEPVMATGGYFGIDPILTVDAFRQMVERGEVFAPMRVQALQHDRALELAHRLRIDAGDLVLVFALGVFDDAGAQLAMPTLHDVFEWM